MAMTEAHKKYRQKNYYEHKAYMIEYRKKNYEIRKQKYVDSGQKASNKQKYNLKCELQTFRKILL